MSINYNEQRQKTRRIHKMPIAFFSNERKGDLAGYFFGWTKDVSPKGVCICAKSNHIPIVDSQLTMLVASEIQNTLSNSDIAVQIKGRVIWHDKENQRFGVMFS